MIDWFVVLAPLLCLPIVLLFAFVGCALGREGEGQPIRLAYGPGFATDVESISVTFTVTKHSEAGSELPSSETITRTEIDPEGTLQASEMISTSELLVALSRAATIDCTCIITNKNTAEQLALIAAPHRKEGDDELTGFYRLSREGAPFTVDAFLLYYDSMALSGHVDF